MIRIIGEKLINSGAEFIVCPVDYSGEPKYRFVKDIYKEYPHVEKEYIKLTKRLRKNMPKKIGYVQYIPVDSWASVWQMESIDRKNLEAYDNQYQYICNTFISKNINPYGKNDYDINVLEYVLRGIAYQASNLNAVVAVPYNFGVTETHDWKKINKIIQNIFYHYNVDLLYCKEKK